MIMLVCCPRYSSMCVSTCGYVPTQSTYVHLVVFLQLLQFEPTNAHNFIESHNITAHQLLHVSGSLAIHQGAHSCTQQLLKFFCT
jgi:hypothetical protein